MIPRPKLHQIYVSLKNIAPRVIIDLLLNNIYLPINDSVNSNPGTRYYFELDCAHAVLMISQSDTL